VRDKKIAAAADGFTDWPGAKYPHLFAFYAVPSPGHTPEEMQKAIREEIDKLRNTYVTDQELQMFKTRARADLLRGLADNSGLAAQLATYQARYGDWRELFRQLDRYNKVTKEDIKRVADETFVPENRTVGIIESTQMAGGQQTKGAAQQ
jgi:predicted Zn-dependent peptidase